MRRLLATAAAGLAGLTMTPTSASAAGGIIDHGEDFVSVSPNAADHGISPGLITEVPHP